MFEVINISKGKLFGEYETRREADRALTKYLIEYDFIKDRFEIRDKASGRVVSRVRNRG